MKAGELITELKRYWYLSGDVVWIDEFRPSVGWHGERSRLDTWALHISPGRGMSAYAFEIKISRTDWLREIKNPMKRRMAFAISNFFYFVTPVGIIKKEELPLQTGLMEIDPQSPETWNRVNTVHSADYRDKVRPTWAFVASALKNYGKNKLGKEEA